jgi:aminoglycoside phosphotransferase (APT) family kinase protein
MIQDDLTSMFSYDGQGDPVTFSLHKLSAVVNSHFSTVCRLEKLAEGCHKVYDIVQENGSSPGVVRVAAPAFPKDKLESEVATLRFLAAHTHIPVPTVYAWNSDPSNPVGAEYMIMQKIPGVPASESWETLSMDVKERVVTQVADYLMEMFALRFDRAGSLYLSSTSESNIVVGPIVSTPFYDLSRHRRFCSCT